MTLFSGLKRQDYANPTVGSFPTEHIDESFVVGGMKMKYTGDPNGGAKNVINCRCVTLYVEEETRIIEDN